MAIQLAQLDLFGGAPVQGSIEKEIVSEHSSITSLQDAYAPITFQISFSPTEFFNIQDLELRLRVQFEIKDENGGEPN